MSGINKRNSSVAKLHHTGTSNTRCGAPLIPEINCLIDYVKVLFLYPFNVRAPWCARLLEVLKVNPDIYDHECGNYGGYTDAYYYDEEIMIMTGGTQGRADQLETSVLQMKGEACRKFELRGGSWKDLISVILDNCIINAVDDKDPSGRFDVAIDLINGHNIITIPKIQHKIKLHDYVTCTRSLKTIESSEDLSTPQIKTYKNGGWSATFGGVSSKQHCIYDKLMERVADGRDVHVESWIRFESRFFRRNAYEALRHVYAALCMEQDPQAVARAISGLVRGVIEFKEKNNEDLRHKTRVPIWKPWKWLLSNAEKVVVKNQARLELTLSKLCRHVDVAYGKALRKTELYNREDQRVYEAWLKYHGGMRITNREVASINYAREEQGLPPLTRESILRNTRDEYEWSVEAPAKLPIERYYMDEKGNKITVDGEILYKNKRGTR